MSTSTSGRQAYAQSKERTVVKTRGFCSAAKVWAMYMCALLSFLRQFFYLFHWWSLDPYLVADPPSVIRPDGWSREGLLHGHELGSDLPTRF
jgi:hypothetical protein